MQASSCMEYRGYLDIALELRARTPHHVCLNGLYNFENSPQLPQQLHGSKAHTHIESCITRDCLTKL